MPENDYAAAAAVPDPTIVAAGTIHDPAQPSFISGLETGASNVLGVLGNVVSGGFLETLNKVEQDVAALLDTASLMHVPTSLSDAAHSVGKLRDAIGSVGTTLADVVTLLRMLGLAVAKPDSGA